MIISSWLNFDRPAPHEKGLRRGENFWLRLIYYSQRAVFASPLSAFLILAFFSPAAAPGILVQKGYSPSPPFLLSTFFHFPSLIPSSPLPILFPLFFTVFAIRCCVCVCIEIMVGSVFIFGNNLLCHETSIEWQDIVTVRSATVQYLLHDGRTTSDYRRQCERHNTHETLLH